MPIAIEKDQADRDIAMEAIATALSGWTVEEAIQFLNEAKTKISSYARIKPGT